MADLLDLMRREWRDFLVYALIPALPWIAVWILLFALSVTGICLGVATSRGNPQNCQCDCESGMERTVQHGE